MPRTATTRTTSRSAKKAPPKGAGKAAPNALDLLIADHKKTRQMFAQFKKMKEKGNSDLQARQTLVQMCCVELMLHAQLEEEIFYPAARAALKHVDLLNEAAVEHAAARQLITELSSMQAEDELYDAKFSVLAEYVMHHVKEEEKELFPMVQKAKMDLVGLAEQMEERRMELRQEYGLEDENVEMEHMQLEEAMQPAKTSRRRNMH